MYRLVGARAGVWYAHAGIRGRGVTVACGRNQPAIRGRRVKVLIVLVLIAAGLFLIFGMDAAGFVMDAVAYLLYSG